MPWVSFQKPRERNSLANRFQFNQAYETTSKQLRSNRVLAAFRILTLVDNFSRESLALRAAERFRGDDVVKVLEYVSAHRGLPKTIRVDNGPEFVSKSLDWWAYFNGVELDFSRPGKPKDNAFIVPFNGKFWQECLNQHWFLSVVEAQKTIESWRDDYNANRPHSALGNRTTVEFATHPPGLAPAECVLVPNIPIGLKSGARSRALRLS